MKFILSWLVTAIAVAAAVWLVPGITTVGDDATIAVAIGALVLALVNVVIKPALQLLSLPITVLTLGIFYLVVNALLLELAAWASTGIFGSGIAVTGFGAALMGSIIISIVSAIMNAVLGTNKA